MPPRRCVRCRRLVPAAQRCGCGPTTRTNYDSTERRRRQQTIADHLEAYGAVCPGWRREMHETSPFELTADHVLAVAAGGAQDGALEVLCRPCNSSKGARAH